ncbi:MAG: coenzyme F420-0:L-glutamate ligase [Candidatus Bathyarchaeia archaeon]
MERKERPLRLLGLSAKALQTPLWLPGSDYESIILEAVRPWLRDGDFIVLSQKALSVALGNIIDESEYKPSLMAKFLARFWMRIGWGYFLGYLCHLKPRTISRLRKYPIEEGSHHKEAILRHGGFGGFLHALRHASEGGIDIVNLPYAYAALPLMNAPKIAEGLRNRILRETGKHATIIISDTDRTFHWRGLYFTTVRNPIKGIKPLGFFAYLIGASLKLKARPTPVAVAFAMEGSSLSLDELLEICLLAERLRGHGAGRDVWEMAERLKAGGLTKVTWDMLRRIPHYPIVLVRVRRARRSAKGRPQFPF